MQTITYSQIDGDFGNPLVYGGSFLSSNGQTWHVVTSDDDDSIIVYRWDAEFLSPFDWVKWDSVLPYFGLESVPDSPNEQALLIAAYHGPHELDSYPERYTRPELESILFK